MILESVLPTLSWYFVHTPAHSPHALLSFLSASSSSTKSRLRSFCDFKMFHLLPEKIHRCNPGTSPHAGTFLSFYIFHKVSPASCCIFLALVALCNLVALSYCVTCYFGRLSEGISIFRKGRRFQETLRPLLGLKRLLENIQSPV